MHSILILGAGNIGVTLAYLLHSSSDYKVYIGDIHKSKLLTQLNISNIEFVRCDIQQPDQIIKLIKTYHITAVVSCLPFYCMPKVARIARECEIDYFDPTEDVEITKEVHEIALSSKGTFATQCGLAPGFISIVTNHLTKNFLDIEKISMRVGALSQNNDNPIQYAFTWSIDGVINEYLNFCETIEDGVLQKNPALSGLEDLVIDGVHYEAFHTSGGCGTLIDTYKGKTQNMNYKTLRYPGHCEKMNFLLNELKLKKDINSLKKILRSVIPSTQQDKVVIYASIEGYKDDSDYRTLEQNSYSKTLYPLKIKEGITFSAIQFSTASAIATIIDMVVHEKSLSGGLIRQENISLDDFLNNRFGQYYLHNSFL